VTRGSRRVAELELRELRVELDRPLGLALRRVGELPEPLRVEPLDHAEARLGGHVVAHLLARRTRVELERRQAALDAARIEAVERPHPAADRLLLLVEPVAQVVAVRDAVAVGDHERRAGKLSASCSACTVCASFAPNAIDAT
jgi:hypothetical protein